MLRKIKEKNEKILKEDFKKALGGSIEVDVDWGFPVSRIQLKDFVEEEKLTTTVLITVDLLNEDSFSLTTHSFRVDEDGKQILGEPTTIDSGTINFISERIKLISGYLFTTREEEPKEKVEAEAQPEVEAEAQPETEVENSKEE